MNSSPRRPRWSADGAERPARNRLEERQTSPSSWVVKTAFMKAEAAQRAANRVGLITLPLGLALVAAPAGAGRLLRIGERRVALRIIGVLDLALVPGLLLDGGRWQWLTARAVLNVGIATYCLRLVQRERSSGPVVAAAAMLAATVADSRAIAVLHRSTGR